MFTCFLKPHTIKRVIRITVVTMFFIVASVSQAGLADGQGLMKTFRNTNISGANITVTTFEDELNSDGDCSLREAVQAANTNSTIDSCAFGTGGDTISLPPGIYTLSIGGNSEDNNLEGDLDITGTLTIAGNSSETTIIQGGTDDSNGIDRVLQVLDNAHLEIQYVIIRYGLSEFGGSPHTNGGGIFVGRDSVLKISHCLITDNKSANGGGIYNEFGTITIEMSTISNNHGGSGGGGLNGVGTVNISDSTFSGNVGIFGGAISNDGIMNITKSTFSENSAFGMGEGYGGAIQNTDVLTITNSTISANSAWNQGGGIRNFGTLLIRNSTIYGNGAEMGGGIVNLGGIAILTNNIIANNPAGDCIGDITSNGYNIDSDNTCGLIGSTDLPNTNPDLDTLANNGGPTFTHAIAQISPAFNAGNCSGGGIVIDQRDVPRPQGKVCDIGAYEYRIYELLLPLLLKGGNVLR